MGITALLIMVIGFITLIASARNASEAGFKLSILLLLLGAILLFLNL